MDVFAELFPTLVVDTLGAGDAPLGGPSPLAGPSSSGDSSFSILAGPAVYPSPVSSHNRHDPEVLSVLVNAEKGGTSMAHAWCVVA
ncbi:uncharacterized protein SCHCODRAFT_0270001 [Schizophyllum commune H4-8]|uniref:Lipopeptide mating pheromone Bap3(2) n=1 Tax=Schizophyllum commune TaxID=5334 RepID=Q6UDE4_SCHCO|nr:uncharacterized protein SCHCODRAFT_0270001 [Schizophyllum commune H4-8]AAR99650.1 lipopeptide mating pheromone precursor Bap3(2) [Schizophyllum commune]KAI5887477.1 hypothetical protein SCHCODRAFT_0270001 [Schizophyllum commune H4-8]